MSADVKANNEKKEVNNKTQQRIFSFKSVRLKSNVNQTQTYILSFQKRILHQKGRVWWQTISRSQPGVIAQSHPHEAKESVVGVGAG